MMPKFVQTGLYGLASAAAVVLSASTVAATAADTDRMYVSPPPPADNRPAAPFSEGILVGGTFYVAGHIGVDPATGNAAADVDTEAHRVLDAVKKTLADAGLTMNDLVSVTVYCTDLKLYDGFNAIYRGYFGSKFPTRAFIGVNQLVRGARFEIAGVAVAPTRKSTKH